MSRIAQPRTKRRPYKCERDLNDAGRKCCSKDVPIAIDFAVVAGAAGSVVSPCSVTLPTSPPSASVALSLAARSPVCSGPVSPTGI
jgi:hypothetical protein